MCKFSKSMLLILTFSSLMVFVLNAFGGKIIQLEEIRVEELSGKTRVTLINTGLAQYACFILDSPPRLVINFVDDNVFGKGKERMPVNKGLVRMVSPRYKGGKAGENIPLDYLVLNLNQPASFHTEGKEDSIVVDLTPLLSEARERRVETNPLTSLKREEKRLESLEDCIKIAIANSGTLKIAEQEVRFAELKVREAERALYPSVMAKLDRTDGKIRSLETGGVDAGFRETEFGLQIGQSIYQGGKLKSTLSQAEVRLEMARKKYEKAKQDLIFEVKKAYYNLVSAQANLRQQEKLLAQGESILQGVGKKHGLELVTTEELLKVQSQYNQVYYNKFSEEKECSLALLTLKHILNFEGLFSVEFNIYLDFEELGISLEQCLELAGKDNPELAISKLSLRFAELGKNIVRGEQRFKVDLTGFYGRGGGAYETEDLKVSDSWYAGIKLSKAIGGSTLGSGYTSDQTNPKLGQSSRTESKTGSATFSLLDNLKNLSDEKEAELEYEKAQNEAKEAEKKIESEVKEAYFNYEKSIIQLKAISKEIEFSKEQARIAGEKRKLNLAPDSEVLGTEISLTGARASYNEALSYYHIALASLNKAIGVEQFK